jgi:predicted ArsR family transcriptional regulator
MLELTPEQIAEYFHRSYSAVDGLWFMKIEEKYGFDVALDIDNEVWKVFPKIQARLLKSMGKLGDGIEALFEALTTKLKLEGFVFKTEEVDNGFKIIIDNCPWHNLMVKSKREALSGKVGTLICNTEYRAWASEFEDNIKFELKHQICTGSKSCILKFATTKADEG